MRALQQKISKADADRQKTADRLKRCTASRLKAEEAVARVNREVKEARRKHGALEKCIQKRDAAHAKDEQASKLKGTRLQAQIDRVRREKEHLARRAALREQTLTQRIAQNDAIIRALRGKLALLRRPGATRQDQRARARQPRSKSSPVWKSSSTLPSAHSNATTRFSK